MGSSRTPHVLSRSSSSSARTSVLSSAARHALFRALRQWQLGDDAVVQLASSRIFTETYIYVCEDLEKRERRVLSTAGASCKISNTMIGELRNSRRCSRTVGASPAAARPLSSTEEVVLQPLQNFLSAAAAALAGTITP